MNKQFYRFSPILVLYILFVCHVPSLYCAQLVDKVVAIVNDDVITMSEVNDAGKAFFLKITEDAPVSQVGDALKRARIEVLNNLIDKKLIGQEAEKAGIDITDSEVTAAAEQMLISNKKSRAELDQQLHEMGITYDAYLDTLRNQILQSKLVNYEVRSKIVITDDMILDYYDTNYTKHVSGGGYYLMQMGFSWKSAPGAAPPAQYAARLDARKRAERVRTLVLNGQDFRTLAHKFSDLPSAADGGDLGVFKEDEMAQYMKDAVLSLNAGDISEIVETPSGFQFFKLLSSKDGQIVVQASFSSVKEDIRQKLYEQKLKEQFDEWVTKIKQDAYIKIL